VSILLVLLIDARALRYTKKELYMAMPFVIVPTVLVMLLREEDDHALLLRRSNTGFADGFYALPGGCVDGKETLRAAAARELFEEVGVTVAVDDLHLMHVAHHSEFRQGKRHPHELLQSYFVATRWQGEAYNKEPHEHDVVAWFNRSHLPEPMLPWALHIVKNYPHIQPYSEYGW
jgi:8-oxo-dGTP diphosphatase